MKEINTMFYEIRKVLNDNDCEGKLIALTSRPGMGKTTFSLNLMRNIVEWNETNVLFFSLESAKEKLMNILSNKWELAPKTLAKIYIDETASPSIDYIEEKICETNNLSVVFIDYIALIKDFTSGSQNAILTKLKNICKSKNVSIIYTCNLTRKLEQRIDKRPILSDLDEFTQKNADVIFALYRASYYTGDDPAAQLRALKNPSGELIEIPLFYDDKDRSFHYDVDCSFDKAPEKRVELSVHTKLSNDVSTIGVREAFDFAMFCGHKAIGFTNLNNVQDFPKIQNISKDYPDLKVVYGAKVFYEENGQGAPLVTLLIKNQKGVKNLYKIISSEIEDGIPGVVDIKVIEKHRENLLLGASGDLSDLFWAIHNEESPDEIKKTALRYDYIELFPSNDIKTRLVYKNIVKLGKELNIPVVATGDCHYYGQEDEIYRRVVKEFKGGADDNNQQYLRNTEDMLKAFAYLGEKDSYDVVIKNSNLIADMIEQVKPLSTDPSEFEIPGADDFITKEATSKAVFIYGGHLSPTIEERLNSELKIIKSNGFSSFYMLAHLLAKYAHENGQPTSSRGSVGSSFVAFLLGITNVNPLPPHYYCSDCALSELILDPDFCSGYDLKEKNCPICGKPLKRDGHNIPFESFMGFYGDMLPDIDLNFPSSFRENVLGYLCELFGEERILMAGTIQTLTPKVAEMYVNMYQETNDQKFEQKLADSIIINIDGVKRQESIHPGGVFILPEGKDACDYTPTKTLNNHSPIKKKTHLEFHSLHDNIYKADILGFIPLEILARIEKYTGVSSKDIDITDSKIYELFKDSRVIGIDSDEPATSGLPEFDINIVRNIIKQTKPSSFGDLVKISALSHGTNTWFYNAEELLKNNICNLSDLPASREDIYNHLISCGIERSLAFKIMQAVRKGRFMRSELYKDPEVVKAFASHNIPDWYMESLCKIRYMFPKAHAIEYVKMALTLAWYKIYYPAEFYAATLNVRYPDDKFEFLCRGKEAIKNQLEATRNFLIEEKGLVQFYKNDVPIDTKNGLFKECTERGILFKRNYDYYESDELYFVKDGIIFMNY